MKAYIYAGGAVDAGLIDDCPEPGDLTVAADAGWRNAQALGVTPAVLVGDFDSLGEPVVPQGTEIVRVPAEKDDTDTQLAVRVALDRGAAEIIRADGHGIPELLDAILALMPLDTYTEKPVLYMAKSECDRDLALPILDEYKKIIEKYDERGEACTGYLERYAFYDKAEQACYIVQSGETSQYANIILQKGVVKRNK